MVDDEEDILTVGELSLSSVGGLETVVASSGEQALDLARFHKPDVILLDVMMPGLDGPATLVRLREDPTTREIPVIFLTARSRPHEVDDYKTLGAAGVIAKPFDPMELPARIRSIILGEQAGARARLSALRAGYVERLRERLDEVAAAIAAARAEGANTPQWARALERVHKLHGTAGSYGFLDVSVALGTVDELLELGDGADWAEIEAALDRAEDAWRNAAEK